MNNRLIIHTNKKESKIVDFEESTTNIVTIDNKRGFAFSPTLLMGFITKDAGGIILINLAAWILIPVALLVISAVLRSNKKSFVKNGTLVFATITNMEHTGIYINHLPKEKLYLSFECNGKQKSTVVSYLVSSGEKITIGMKIPIIYDPFKDKAIVADGDSVDKTQLQDAYTESLIQKGVTTQHAVELVKNGVKAMAVIMKITPTGKILHGLGEMEISLKITKSSGEQYEATVFKVIPPEFLPKFLPGAVVMVYYDKVHVQDIAIAMNSEGV